MSDDPLHIGFDPQNLHQRLMEEVQPRLGWRNQPDLDRWREELAAALAECIGELPEPAASDPVWTETIPAAGFRMRRVAFTTEPGVRAVAHLLTPPGEPPAGGRPTMICLQGHSSGAHISWGEAQYPGDDKDLADDHDYAIQAVRRGFNAFALEQRGFGERMDRRPAVHRGHYDYERPFSDERCRHQAMVALLLGRTLIGERVHDVRSAIRLLAPLPEVDATRIACMGNSGGGTVSWYAAALEPRIAAVMAGGAVCSYAASIGGIDHCSDNYLPGALKEFDMGDLAGLIAPRPALIVAGDRDLIFPVSGVKEAFTTAQEIYVRLGAADKIGFHLGSGGHRFYAEAWENFTMIASDYDTQLS